MLSDQEATLSELRQVVDEFVNERDWEKFHSPKNISMALAVEAAELMEHFQWISMDESRAPDAAKLEKIGEEIADVFCYTMAISNSLGIDLAQTFERKMVLNRAKYPSEDYRGRFGKDDPSSVSP